MIPSDLPEAKERKNKVKETSKSKAEQLVVALVIQQVALFSLRQLVRGYCSGGLLFLQWQDLSRPEVHRI